MRERYAAFGPSQAANARRASAVPPRDLTVSQRYRRIDAAREALDRTCTGLDVPHDARRSTGCFRRLPAVARSRRRAASADPMLAGVHPPVRRDACRAGGIAPSLAANCSSAQANLIARVQCQVAGQEAVLAYFNTLPGLAAGNALLAANLRTEEVLYLGSTQQQRIASGTVFIIQGQALQANILLRAFPANPNFVYNSAGLPTAPELPASVTGAVDAIILHSQVVAMKPLFGSADVYGHAYGLLPGQVDSIGNPPPYQVSAAIHDNPFTAANSSPLAAANQQTNNGFGVNWQGQNGGDSQDRRFPERAHDAGHLQRDHLCHPGAGILSATGPVGGAVRLRSERVRRALSAGRDRRADSRHLRACADAGRAIRCIRRAIPANLASLSQAMQAYLGGGGSSPYAAAVRRQRRRLRRRRHRSPAPRPTPSKSQTYTHDPDLRPAIGRRHDLATGRAAGCLLH